MRLTSVEGGASVSPNSNRPKLNGSQSEAIVIISENDAPIRFALVSHAAERNGTERNGTERNGTERNGTERNGTERNGTVGGSEQINQSINQSIKQSINLFQIFPTCRYP